MNAAPWIPKGRMGYRSPRWKAAREEREKLKEAEMEADVEMHQEESAEIKKALKGQHFGQNQKRHKTTFVRHWQLAGEKQRK